MQSRDFATIDRMYDEFLRDNIRATDGVPMIDAFRRALGNYFLIYTTSRTRANSWPSGTRKSPASKLEPVAQADM